MRKLVALLAALITLSALVVAPVVAPGAPGVPKAHADAVLWGVEYGASFTHGNQPNVWSNRNPMWSVPSGNPMHMDFQRDGNLVIYADFTTPEWASNTAGIPSPSHAVWQDDGNFVIYAGSGLGLHAYFSTRTNLGAGYYYMFFTQAPFACLKVQKWNGSSWPNIWTNGHCVG